MRRFDRLLNRFGLNFANVDDEECFTDAHIRSATRINQIFLAIGAFAYASYYVWDRIIDPDNQHLAIMIRIFFVGPILLACSASLFFKPFIRRVESVVVTAGIALFVAQSWIYIILDNGFNYAAMGFVLTFLAMATAFIIRVRYLIILAPVAVITAVCGHIYAGNAQPGWLIVNILGISAAVMIGMVSSMIRESAARTQFMSERALAQSTARADELLHSILPGDIVERIQSGETDISDMLGEVSIVFADLAGFTSLSRRLSPPDLIRLLDEIFSRFDRVAQHYGARSLAVTALQQPCNEIIHQQQLDPHESFYPLRHASTRWRPATPSETGCWRPHWGGWERMSTYSSFYAGDTPCHRLEITGRLGFRGPEMARRLKLVQARFGSSA